MGARILFAIADEARAERAIARRFGDLLCGFV
jgi:hypothetical protein